MNTSTTKRFGLALLIAGLSGTAIAVEPQSSDADLLRGPDVVETSGPDAGDSMTGSAEASRKAGDMPFRSYMGAVRGLNRSAKDHPELALTDEQQEAIKEIGKTHQEKMRAFMEEHKAELDALRPQRGERTEQRGQRGGQKRGERPPPPPPPPEMGDDMMGGEPPMRPEVSPEERQRNREKLGELMANAPSDQDAKKQLWAVLTVDQQAAVKENISKMRDQREKRVDQALTKERKEMDPDLAAKKGERKRPERKQRPERRGDD
tara:strand:+ start:7653 stop:8441 length:789 start_codon:yes stop_codon:yes gene_type:complete